jgi:hypothetical protein
LGRTRDMPSSSPAVIPRATGPPPFPPDDTSRRPPHPAPQTVTIASRLSQ